MMLFAATTHTTVVITSVEIARERTRFHLRRRLCFRKSFSPSSRTCLPLVHLRLFGITRTKGFPSARQNANELSAEYAPHFKQIRNISISGIPAKQGKSSPVKRRLGLLATQHFELSLAQALSRCQ